MRLTVVRHFKAEAFLTKLIPDPDTVHPCFIVGRDVGRDVAGHVVQGARGPAVSGQYVRVCIKHTPFNANVPLPPMVRVPELIRGRVGHQVKCHGDRPVHHVDDRGLIWTWPIPSWYS